MCITCTTNAYFSKVSSIQAALESFQHITSHRITFLNTMQFTPSKEHYIGPPWHNDPRGTHLCPSLDVSLAICGPRALLGFMTPLFWLPAKKWNILHYSVTQQSNKQKRDGTTQNKSGSPFFDHNTFWYIAVQGHINTKTVLAVDCERRYHIGICTNKVSDQIFKKF